MLLLTYDATPHAETRYDALDAVVVSDNVPGDDDSVGLWAVEDPFAANVEPESQEVTSQAGYGTMIRLVAENNVFT